MLKKLLKYDFKTLSHSLLPAYAISLLLSVVGNIFIRLNDLTAIFKIPMTLIVGLSVIVAIGIVFMTFIIGIINFYKQTVKDEGYLVHTLPVSKNNIITSKLITLTVMEIISFLIAVVAVIITFKVSPSKVVDIVKYLIERIGGYKLTTTLMLIGILIGQISNTLLIYVSISFGQKHPTNKLLYSIIYGVVIYNVTQIATTVLYLPLLLNNSFVKALEQTVPTAKVLNITLGMTIGLSLIISVVYYILTKKNLETKLNLE